MKNKAFNLTKNQRDFLFSNRKFFLILTWFTFYIPIAFAQNVGIGTENPQGELHVSRPYNWQGVTFTGTGVDDINVNHSGYTGSSERTYKVKVSNAGPDPNKFDWSDDNGTTWTTNVDMSESPITLSYGIQVYWDNDYGHTYNDEWSFTIGPDYPDGFIVKYAQVGIGTASPVSCAKLDIEGSDKGLLVPRTDTTTVKNANSGSLTAGLLIYQTGDNTFYYYDGSKWAKLTSEKHFVFERNGTVIRQKGHYDTDDFIIGRDSLPQNGQTLTDTILFFDKSKGAFRVGRIYYSQNWSPDNIGLCSFAAGDDTKATGKYSTALGSGTTASGFYSTALGYNTVASGDKSTSLGFNSEASGLNSMAVGYHATASGTNSLAMGNYVTAPSGYETALGQFNTTYTPNNSTSWDEDDRLFVIGNGTISSHHNALTLMKNGKLGLNTDDPGSELHIIDDKDADNDVVLRMQSNGSNNDAIIEFYEGTAEAMSLHYDGGNDALYITDLTTTPDTKRLKIVRSTGSIVPQAHKVADLGSSSLAWDDIYYDDLHNMGAAAFTDREVTKELLNYPPKPKPAGAFDEKTEKGLRELDPNSVPPALRDGYDILTDEMTTYNYKANYEQQQQINELKEIVKIQNRKIEEQNKRIEQLMKLVAEKK